jgi:hypothetical protein
MLLLFLLLLLLLLLLLIVDNYRVIVWVAWNVIMFGPTVVIKKGLFIKHLKRKVLKIAS